MNDRSVIPRPAKPIGAPAFMLATDHNVNKANYQYQHLISFNEKKWETCSCADGMKFPEDMILQVDLPFSAESSVSPILNRDLFC